MVGRTRFCIHPGALVKNIPAVGGTKDILWQKVDELKPDLFIFDKEENPKEMAEACSYPFFTTHVTSLESAAIDLERMSKFLATSNSTSSGTVNLQEQNKLTEMSIRYNLVISRGPGHIHSILDLEKSLGTVEWIKKPRDLSEIEKVEYVIWKDPWMVVSKSTFIGSILTHLGFSKLLPNYPTPYPKLASLGEAKTLYLFSSEPYPFHKKKSEIENIEGYSAIVDGENFSWFGVRSLRFLERLSLN